MSEKDKAVAKDMYCNQGVPVKSLAKHFGISYGACFRMTKRENWIRTPEGVLKNKALELERRRAKAKKKNNIGILYDRAVSSERRNLTGVRLAQMQDLYENKGSKLFQLAEAFNITAYMVKKHAESGQWKRNAEAIEESRILLEQRELFVVEYKKRDPWPADQRFDRPGMVVVFVTPKSYVSTQ